ncbi:helix-turn-helix domain-containing protein [Solimonas sp. K1W22B-7]|uniref:helix-turn-helix domain-containing protein n=1 Tax=Solimonas sp. K1W22B-7 TaxID=2303331 RepID=UPI001968E134|nr:AraC family transcriptional regulator [Solimonas sp. K1W22B-7]
METLFVFDKRNYQDCRTAFRGPRNREYYTGDYSIEPGAVIDVRAECKAVGSSSIIRLRSRTRQSFSRTWAHIREDATDVAVLCFVKLGRLRVSHQRGETLAQAGDFILTKSMTPFSVECEPGKEGLLELLHLTVPMHLLRRVLCHDVTTGFCVPAAGRNFAIAERILADLFEDTGEVKEHVQQLLVDTALSVLAEAIKDHESCVPQRQTLADKRLQDVLRFIETHLSDPKLSIVMVAKGCGISPRYLLLLLKLHGTLFSTLVWDKRLKTAEQWLATSGAGDAAISEIAYRVGFKSPAHFSRMFKREFKLSPRQYRAAAAGTPARKAGALVVDGGDSRH